MFTGVRGGGPLRASIFRRGHFDAAAKAIGLSGLHPHELRHTAASLAIAAGADPKVVQQMLGHSSATMTMTPTDTFSTTRLDDAARSSTDQTPALTWANAQDPLPAVAQRPDQPQVSGRKGTAPPAGFEPALPPPETRTKMIELLLLSTFPQVSSDTT